MYNSNQLATIRQLLVLVYLVIAIPGVALVTAVAVNIDARIALSQNTRLDGEAFFAATEPHDRWLNDVGRTLRKLNAPFSKSSSLQKTPAFNRKAALDLSDFRGALIYISLLIFLLGAAAVSWLGNRLNGPLSELTEAIRKLTHQELVELVNIQGPKNIREMSDRLNHLRLRLKESDTLQTQFLRHISHEIKTPLTSIKEGSQLLEDEILGPINDEQREITEILNKSTRELQNSIESLLSYNSAISVDKVKQRQSIDLANIVNDVVSRQALAIKKKSIKVNLDLRSANAFVDSHQALTVFDNLLSNAIKFSPVGGVIKIWLMPEENQAVFTMLDNGPGVPEKHKRAIFEAFFVGEQSANNTVKGTGLGLSIARRYVELHEGSIELLDTRKGAAFRVTFKS